MAECNGNIKEILTSDMARRIYAQVKDLPIVDYHCHLSPREIYEDKPFENIGQMWLAGDHYKWRLMRACGIDEEYITGEKSWKEKYLAFCDAVSRSPGNPIWDWTAMELEKFFGVKKPFLPENAEEIWRACNDRIVKEKLSPRKAIAMCNVEYIATTDDPCDDLKYHKLLKEEGYPVRVAPSFRTDNIVNVSAPTYLEYVKKLSAASGVEIKDYFDLQEAVRARLDHFCAMGCKFSDVGVEGFPSFTWYDKMFEDGPAPEPTPQERAAAAFDKIMKGEELYASEEDALKDDLYCFLSAEYAERDMVMQLHLCVTRDCNNEMYGVCGKDSGFDCVGENIEIKRLNRFLDQTHFDGKPFTIIYSLNPTIYYPLITLCGAFPGVVPGISWWFNDHRRGITELLAAAAELSSIDSLVGMLTDSRSFLSYPRHDYFRKILCEFLAGVTPEVAEKYAVKVAKDLCCHNARRLVEESK